MGSVCDRAWREADLPKALAKELSAKQEGARVFYNLRARGGSHCHCGCGVLVNPEVSKAARASSGSARVARISRVRAGCVRGRTRANLLRACRSHRQVVAKANRCMMRMNKFIMLAQFLFSSAWQRGKSFRQIQCVRGTGRILVPMDSCKYFVIDMVST